MALLLSNALYAQVTPKNDTFFLLKKKGLLKKLGKSIYRENLPEAPIKSVNPFIAYKGKVIRSIQVAPTGFNKIMKDSSVGVSKTFAAKMADAFHKNTLPTVIRKNLFFKEGDKVLPLLFSDNERYLRDLTFIKDALIVVQADSCSNYVDVFIVTKDVFSIGGSLNISGPTKGNAIVREDNLFGTGNKLEYASLYDKDRQRQYGLGLAYTQRNINHSFINWSTGFTTFGAAFNSGRKEEQSFYTSFEKPLVSRYDAWTAAAVFSYKTTDNNYLPDSLYQNNFKYKLLVTDVWAGYNIGHKNRKERDSEKRLRHFVAVSTFYNKFYEVPAVFKSQYNYSYADINGALLSYSLYKQNFYRTNFIYGFGRNEDVPEGLNATIIGGYTNKQGFKRGYYGIEFDGTHYAPNGCFTAYTFKAGSFVNRKQFEDADIVIGINKFTQLYTLSKQWRNRNFFSINYTQQFNTFLNAPLVLASTYGLPYFRNNIDAASRRTTVKFESVFYNLQSIAGFRIAPFIFTDVSLLQPQQQAFKYTKGYTAIGGGFRTRNENLTFGTVEVKGFYFPRIYEGLKGFKFEIGTNIRFKYNSSFIRKPAFIAPN